MKRALALIAVVALLVAVAAIAACGGGDSSSATPAASPTAATSPTATATGGGSADEASIFSDKCSGCHGPDGSGGRGPNIQGKTDTAAIESQVNNGGASMPAFGGELTPAEIEAVATYVTAL